MLPAKHFELVCSHRTEVYKMNGAYCIGRASKALTSNDRIWEAHPISAIGRVPTSARIKFNLLERQVDSVSRRSAPSVFSPANDCCRIAKLTVNLKNQ